MGADYKNLNHAISIQMKARFGQTFTLKILIFGKIRDAFRDAFHFKDCGCIKNIQGKKCKSYQSLNSHQLGFEDVNRMVIHPTFTVVTTNED